MNRLLTRARLAGMIATLALLTPIFIAFKNAPSSGKHYIAWTLFEVSYAFAYPKISFFTDWILIDAVLSFACFVGVAAGALLLLSRSDKAREGAALVAGGVSASGVDIVTNLFYPTRNDLTVIPIGLLLATASAILAYTSPIQGDKKNSRLLALLPVAVIIAGSIFAYLGSASHSAALQSPVQVCTSDFVELEKIQIVSRFRSTVGHDYSDSYERDLSMKHYFFAKPEFEDQSSVGVFSPLDGTVLVASPDSSGEGNSMIIQSASHPEYTVIIFHITPAQGIAQGRVVTSGERIGAASLAKGSGFDIAVWRHMGVMRDKLYSFFSVATDGVFYRYQARGVPLRSTLIKSPEEARASSLQYSWAKPNPADLVTLKP